VNRKMSIVLLLMAMVLACLLPAAAENKKDNVADIGNRRVAHRSIISEEKEIAIGKEYASQIDKTARLIKDPVVTEYVNRVAQNIARNSDLKVPLTVKVIDDPSINAFASDEEDQIAGVMAHEIAHVAARHWASQMTKATILNYATLPLIFIPMSYPVYLGTMEAMNFGVPIAFLKFSRADEAEADFLGIQYMYKAGYDPNSYVAFFGKVLQEERRDPGSVPKIFMDHPPTPDRIVKSEEEIKTLLPKKPEYLVTTSEFNDVKARLQTLVAGMRRHEKSGPTLNKREPTSKTGTQKGQGQSTDDKPPVLKRRDSNP
jgi:predicted Zn-dependent protease